MNSISPLVNCETTGKLLNFLNPSFVFYKMGIFETVYLAGLLCRLDKIFHEKWLEHTYVFLSLSSLLLLSGIVVEQK